METGTGEKRSAGRFEDENAWRFIVERLQNPTQLLADRFGENLNARVTFETDSNDAIIWPAQDDTGLTHGEGFHGKENLRRVRF